MDWYVVRQSTFIKVIQAEGTIGFIKLTSHNCKSRCSYIHNNYKNWTAAADIQWSLVFGLPWTDDGEDNGHQSVNGWDSPGQCLYDQNLAKLSEVLSEHEHGFSPQDVFVNVSEQ